MNDMLPNTRNYVAADDGDEPIAGEIMQRSYALDVAPHATATVRMETSATDRARGFVIASMPRTFVFSLGIVCLAIMLTGLSLAWAVVALLLIFGLIELTSYVFTLLLSSEGIAWMEARRKWRVIEREQAKRWEHYR